MKKTKVIFMGTPSFAVPILEMLNKEVDVVLVVTQPDKITGRKKILTPSPVKECALSLSLPVFQPPKIKETPDKILNTPCDLIITCAYGQILPSSILNYPKLGCINVHASLLPKYRGGAPIQWALLNGEKESGVTIMQMDEQMDNGDIICMAQEKILPNDDINSYSNKLSLLGASLLKQTLPDIIANKIKPQKQQTSLVSFAPTIKRSDEHLSFLLNGETIINKIRALTPYTYFLLDSLEYKVIKAHFHKTTVSSPNQIIITKKEFGITCQDGIIYLDIIKPFGKKEMDIKSFLNGLTSSIQTSKIS